MANDFELKLSQRALQTRCRMQSRTAAAVGLVDWA
jgi:hypothetical protein